MLPAVGTLQHLERSEHSVIVSGTNTHEKVMKLAPIKTFLPFYIEGKRHNAETDITGFNNNTSQKERRQQVGADN